MTKVADLVAELTRLDLKQVERLGVEVLPVFERYRQHAGDEADIGRDEGVSELRRAVIDVLQRSARGPAPLVGALSVLRDPSLVPFFRRCLSWQLGEQDAGALYATMVALDELGENIFDGRMRRSVIDWQANRQLVIRYLDGLGVDGGPAKEQR